MVYWDLGSKEQQPEKYAHALFNISKSNLLCHVSELKG